MILWKPNQIDISKVPFSKYGSYIALCHNPDKNYLTIHNARRLFGEDLTFILEFEKAGQTLEYSVESTPYMINIKSSSGNSRIYLRGDESLTIECVGIGFRLEMVQGKVSWGYEQESYPVNYGIRESDRRIKMIRVDARLYVAIDVLLGNSQLKGPFEISPGGQQRDCRTCLQVSPENDKALVNIEISQLETKPHPIKLDVEKDIAMVKQDWDKFLAKMPPVPADRKDVAEMTWYNLWSSFVRADDCYAYDAMLMSKNYMCSVWSWDHCFNALAMASADLRIAIEQFLLPFELQADSGALPDSFNPNNEIVWGVTKPPIHGWCFSLLMERHEIEENILRKVFSHLEKWTNWWMGYRDSDGDGTPEYPQGCDGGGDNYTIFDIGYFLEAPDLSAFLVMQMKTLSKIAEKLRDSNASEYWQEQAAILLEKLYEHSWNGKKFVAKLSISHEYDDNPTALAVLLPIVLGEYLDKEKFDKLVAILEQNFLTEHGPATEALNSPKYESDSYWRGPIWAPSTYLIVDGLRRGGRSDLARKIAVGFCDMIKNIAGGNYENFDAVTGEGLRAPGYTWTASVHMLLLTEFIAKEPI